ncbi:MAG: MEDS domain-containing protein [Gemmatimonadales bacterium]|nr:MEDS domain-containing protein [Gemmatimonadales bacterium]
MQSCPHWLETPRSPAHIVQLYGEDHGALAGNVSRFLYDGWKLGDGLLVVATAQHREAIVERLRAEGMDPTEAERQGQLVLLSAETVLAEVLVGGSPSPLVFDGIIGKALRSLLDRAGATDLRAFGELVGLAWRAGLYSAAAQLEELWHQLLSAGSFKVLCAYPIDLVETDAEADLIAPVLQAHTHLLASVPGYELALCRRLDCSDSQIVDRAREFATKASVRRRSPIAGLLKTGDAARVLGTTARTLLFYEEEGLIRPRRTARGSRLYSRFDLARAAIAIRLSQMGFPLKLVKRLASARSTARTGREASARLVVLLESLQQEVRERASNLGTLGREIQHALSLVRRCSACPHPPTSTGCPACPSEAGADESALLQLTQEANRSRSEKPRS